MKDQFDRPHGRGLAKQVCYSKSQHKYVREGKGPFHRSALFSRGKYLNFVPRSYYTARYIDRRLVENQAKYDEAATGSRMHLYGDTRHPILALRFDTGGSRGARRQRY